jgi:hypothetical protein
VQATTVTARAASTATTGGLANPFVALAELALAVLSALAAIVVPILALCALLVLVVCAVLWWRSRRAKPA